MFIYIQKALLLSIDMNPVIAHSLLDLPSPLQNP